MKRCLLTAWPGVLLAAALFWHSPTALGALSKSAVLEKNVGYLRIVGADQGLLGEIQPVLNKLESTNTLAGVVLDLRFAHGADSANLQPVEQMLEQTRLPLAILINGQTDGAAARLAEDLREANTGLVFGAAAGNFQPDIPVTVNLNDEKNFLNNPYGLDGTNADSSTNLLPFVDIDHTTEADLVREKIKDGDQDDSSEPPASLTPQTPFIHDPVLARGVDFIKGVAALRLSKN